MHNPHRGFSHKIRQKRLSRVTYSLFDFFKHDRDFVILLGVLLIAAFFVAPYTEWARWFGFVISSYAVIGNDSIQTLGMFITSNSHKVVWWKMWLFIGSIFVATVGYSWYMYGGDVSYERLQVEGLATHPGQFTFLQLTVPILLLLLTRMRVPLSTTFLLLNMFSTETSLLWHMIRKSLLGYVTAFGMAFLLWYLASAREYQGKVSRSPARWFVLQWLSTGLLWMSWLMQDGANIAVFLPRRMPVGILIVFVTLILAGLGILLYDRGGKIQHLVNEKSGITDIRAATYVSLVYMSLLFFFKVLNRIPMSSTWIFIGLLGGRELGKSFHTPQQYRYRAIKKSGVLIKRDLSYACLGLVLSVLVALWINGGLTVR